MRNLSIYGENCLFVSQHVDNDKEHATVLINAVKKDDNEAYLAIRRLLNALKYRLQDVDLQLDFELTRKGKK